MCLTLKTGFVMQSPLHIEDLTYASAYVLSNLLNEMRKQINTRLVEYFITLATSNEFNYERARLLHLSHVIKMLKNRIFA